MNIWKKNIQAIMFLVGKNDSEQDINSKPRGKKLWINPSIAIA